MGKIDYILINRMNYHYADRVYRNYRLEDTLADDFSERVKREFASL